MVYLLIMTTTQTAEEIIARATMTDNMGTKSPYAEAARDPFEGTPYASPELYR